MADTRSHNGKRGAHELEGFAESPAKLLAVQVLLISSLPTDVLRIILRFVPSDNASDIPTRATCRRFRDLLSFPSREQRRVFVYNAVVLGYVSLVRWGIEEMGYPVPRQLDITAFKYGRAAILHWLILNDYPLNPSACEYAVRYGQDELLPLLREKGCPWDKQACLKAAIQGGNLSFLRVAFENRELVLNVSLSAKLAASGNLGQLLKVVTPIYSNGRISMVCP